MKTSRLIPALGALLALVTNSGFAAAQIPSCDERAAVDGPVSACLTRHGDQTVLELGYTGFLCYDYAHAPVMVGVVQNGSVKATFPVWEYRAGCGAVISLDGIEDGELAVFIHAGAQYDSNYGRNFRFYLRRGDLVRGLSSR